MKRDESMKAEELGDLQTMVGHRRYTNNRIPGVNAIALTLHLARKWMVDVQLKYAVGSLTSTRQIQTTR
jgi:hypothetical protein